MLKDYAILARQIAMMNAEGVRLLASMAKDVTGHAEYRKGDGDLTPEQFNTAVEQVLELVDLTTKRSVRHEETTTNRGCVIRRVHNPCGCA